MTSVSFRTSFAAQPLNSQGQNRTGRWKWEKRLSAVGGVVIHAVPLLPEGPGAPEWPASLGMRSRTPGLSALPLSVNARTLAKRLDIGSVPFQLDCLSERTSSKENFRTRESEIKGSQLYTRPGPRESGDGALTGVRPALPTSFPVQGDSPTLNRKKQRTDP